MLFDGYKALTVYGIYRAFTSSVPEDVAGDEDEEDLYDGDEDEEDDE